MRRDVHLLACCVWRSGAELELTPVPLCVSADVDDDDEDDDQWEEGAEDILEKGGVFFVFFFVMCETNSVM